MSDSDPILTHVYPNIRWVYESPDWDTVINIYVLNPRTNELFARGTLTFRDGERGSVTFGQVSLSRVTISLIRFEVIPVGNDTFIFEYTSEMIFSDGTSFATTTGTCSSTEGTTTSELYFTILTPAIPREV
jgi:hypothetical protein